LGLLELGVKMLVSGEVGAWREVMGGVAAGLGVVMLCNVVKECGGVENRRNATGSCVMRLQIAGAGRKIGFFALGF
jgi:hypothetical protein